MNSLIFLVSLLTICTLSLDVRAGRLASESMKDEFCQTDSPKQTDMSGNRCEDEFEIARDVCHFGTRSSSPKSFKSRYCRLHQTVQSAKKNAGYGAAGSVAANQIIKDLADAGQAKADMLNDMARAVYNREHYHAAACESAVANCISMCGGMSEAIVNKCMRLQRDAEKLTAAAEQAGELGGLRVNTVLNEPKEEQPEIQKPLPKTSKAVKPQLDEPKKRKPAKDFEDDWDDDLDSPINEPEVKSKPRAKPSVKTKKPARPKVRSKSKPVKKSNKPKDEMDLLLDNIESEMGFD